MSEKIYHLTANELCQIIRFAWDALQKDTTPNVFSEFIDIMLATHARAILESGRYDPAEASERRLREIIRDELTDVRLS